MTSVKEFFGFQLVSECYHSYPSAIIAIPVLSQCYPCISHLRKYSESDTLLCKKLSYLHFELTLNAISNKDIALDMSLSFFLCH